MPVARASWGLGGGVGRQPDGKESGSGAGGGVTVRPVGYIELRDGRSRFRPIREPISTGALLVAVGGLALLAGRLLGRLRSPRNG